MNAPRAFRGVAGVQGHGSRSTLAPSQHERPREVSYSSRRNARDRSQSMRTPVSLLTSYSTVVPASS